MLMLQDLVDSTPPGGTLDLGADTYPITESVVIRKPITITGTDASIVLAWSAERSLPNIICRADDVQLVGRVNVVGSKGDGHLYEASREAQHGIELQGAARFACVGWTIRNTWGNAVYIGKHDDQWSEDVTLSNLTTKEIGRQQISLVAVHGALITDFFLRSGNRSVFDIEPPGHDWGAQNVRIDGGRVTSQHGFLLACKGVGSTNSVSGIHLSNIVCHNRLVNVMVEPPEGTRRSDFSIVDCTSDVEAHSTPLRFARVDGLTVRGVVQRRSKGVAAVQAVDCPGAVLT